MSPRKPLLAVAALAAAFVNIGFVAAPAEVQPAGIAIDGASLTGFRVSRAAY